MVFRSPFGWRLLAGVWLVACLMASPALAGDGPFLPRFWEPEETEEITEGKFLEAVTDFLSDENIDPQTVQIGIRPLQEADDSGTMGRWRALAQVFVDEIPQGGYHRKLVFDRDYWLHPGENRLLLKQRWAKLMWHEVHHLKFFPVNLRKARELALTFPPLDVAPAAWRQKWIKLLEPLEEWAAEHESLRRVKLTFGPVEAAILEDSRSDLRKHARRYAVFLSDILVNAQDPDSILKMFPPQLRVDSEGNILPSPK
jgi:hypothetical protein